MDKNFYNEASAKKLGWEPSWFGEKHFDDKLVRAIKKWQRARQLAADGMCGPSTFRRLWTERQSDIDDHKPENPHYSNYIVYNGEFFPIEWDKFVLWSEKGGMESKPGHYYDYSGRAKRKIRYFVNHWDVCLNSKSCQRVVDRRSVSVHFLIDNDGTIYQTMDLQHVAWHAGNSKVNAKSIGVEISNAYDLKWQRWYKKNGFGERAIVRDAYVHGKRLRPHLDFYPVQIEALMALWKACHNACGIPYETPTGDAKNAYTSQVSSGRFKGYVSHYHVTKKKIDCGGLDIEKLLEDLK